MAYYVTLYSQTLPLPLCAIHSACASVAESCRSNPQVSEGTVFDKRRTLTPIPTQNIFRKLRRRDMQARCIRSVHPQAKILTGCLTARPTRAVFYPVRSAPPQLPTQTPPSHTLRSQSACRPCNGQFQSSLKSFQRSFKKMPRGDGYAPVMARDTFDELSNDDFALAAGRLYISLAGMWLTLAVSGCPEFVTEAGCEWQDSQAQGRRGVARSRRS